MKRARVVFIALFVAGCVTSTPGSHPNSAVGPDEAMRRASVVTMGRPQLDPSKPSVIVWAGMLQVIGKHPVLSTPEIQQRMTEWITKAIVKKGYQVQYSSGDFQLEAVMVMADDTSADTLLKQRIGLDPGLATQNENVGKGTLALTLKQGHAVRWRGSVQILMTADYDAGVAQQRSAYAVWQLINTWP